MKYTVVQFGDSHWEAAVDGKSLWHYEGNYGGAFGGDSAYSTPNRYGTEELAIKAIEAQKVDDDRRQRARDKDARDRRVLKIIEI